ncbi:hypothetical protein [Acidithiobacillus ferriphilus]|uniref:hypothetical protein n=1 Tax=Acidithiobacillus ferriphilus TaxID=1689834 RepID=UPI000B1A6577|nr:hypothetical protein [Acidithiobacillus ferriphilus]MEB8603167.1 hypothetical protein [Acidithiobacillus ferriphilus]
MGQHNADLGWRHPDQRDNTEPIMQRGNATAAMVGVSLSESGNHICNISAFKI